MTPSQCPHETEVLEAIESGDWSEDLMSHARDCSVCRDLAEVALAFSDDYAAILSETRVPPAALVWWRAELESRQEAARKATRPVTLIHAVAVACTLGVALGLGRGLISPGRELVGDWASRLAEGFSLSATAAETATEVNATGGPLAVALALAVGCCLMLAPLAAYFIFSDD